MELISIVSFVQQVITTLKALEISFKGIGAYESARVNTSSPRLQLSVSRQKLLSLSDSWMLDFKSVADESSLDSIWGPRGLWNILNILHTIHRQGIDLLSLVQSGDEIGESRLNKAARRVGKLGIGFGQRKKQQMAFDMLKWVPKIEELSRHVDVLCTMSEVYFRAVHRTYESSPTKTSPTHFWGDLMCSRAESRALYDFCETLSSAKFLEIDVLGGKGLSKWVDGSEQDVRNQLCFRLLLNGPTNVAGGLRDWTARPRRDTNIAFSDTAEAMAPCKDFDALEKVLASGNPSNVLLSSPKSDFEAVFLIDRRPDPTAFNQDQESVEALLQHNLKPLVDRTRTHQMSLLEKYKLANKIAELCLFFLGTPWMIHLTSKNLRRFTSADGLGRYMLQFGDSEEEEDTGHQTPSTSIDDQIVSIGALLMELALDNHSPGSYSTISPEDLLDVQGAMGHKYRAACEFCLRRSRSFGLQTHIPNHGVQRKNSDHLESSDVNTTAFSQNSLRRSSADSVSSWIVVDNEESPAEIINKLQQFYEEVFSRLNDAYKAVEVNDDDND